MPLKHGWQYHPVAAAPLTTSGRVGNPVKRQTYRRHSPGRVEWPTAKAQASQRRRVGRDDGCSF